MKDKKNLNILMILSNPFMVDPRVYKEAKSLVGAGYSVVVIVWDRHKDYIPEEIVDGIKIIRVYSNKLMKLLLHDLFRNPVWWRIAYKKALELNENGFDIDIVHCHDLDTLKVGVWLKKKLGVKLVYDAHEIFGYMAARTMPKFVVKYTFKLEKKLIKNIDHIITAESAYNDYFTRLGCNSITTIFNCKDLVSAEYKPPMNDIFTIIYIGVLNRSRFFPEILEVIGKIKNVNFIIAGKKENLFSDIEILSKKFKNIKFIGSIPYSQVIPNTIKSNIVLCMIKPNDMNNKISTANKQFEAMVCGRPIICTKGTKSGEITSEEDCGLVVEYDKYSLEKAIIHLRDSPELCEKLGRNALEAAINKYNWEKEEKKLLTLYKKLEVGD